MVIRACRAVTGCVLYAVCVYVCVHVCVSVSKRLTAGCEEGQSQSGSYSNAHCPLATLPSLFLVRSRSLLRGVSLPLTVILTHSTVSLSLTLSLSLPFSLHFTGCLPWCILTQHTNSNLHTTVFTHLLTTGLEFTFCNLLQLIRWGSCYLMQFPHVKTHIKIGCLNHSSV